MRYISEESSAFYAELEKNYPLVYSTFPDCGFYPLVGWHDIIRELSEKIQKYLEERGSNGFEVKQVKEKFGGLRFYTNSVDTNIHAFILQAEEKAYKVCTECGKAAHTYKGSTSLYKLCEEHILEVGNRD